MGIISDKTDKMLVCIEACSNCAQACFECFNECLNEPDLANRKNCLSILIECAMMCQMSFSMMSMSGQFSADHCAVCAKVCEKCAIECDMFEDEHCQNCADICKMCSSECQKMATM